MCTKGAMYRADVATNCKPRGLLEGFAYSCYSREHVTRLVVFCCKVCFQRRTCYKVGLPSGGEGGGGVKTGGSTGRLQGPKSESVGRWVKSRRPDGNPIRKLPKESTGS